MKKDLHLPIKNLLAGLLLLLPAVYSGPLHAQQRKLSLHEALNEARANNPLVLQEQYDIAHTDWAIRELQADNLPEFSVSTMISRLGEPPGVPVDFGDEQQVIQLGGKNSFRTRFELNQKILDFGRTNHRVQAAKFGQRAQRASYNRELNRVSVLVKTAYYAVLHHMRIDSMYANILDQQEKLEQISRARFNEQVLLEPALLQARADVQLAAAQQARMQGEIAKSSMMLAKLMGTDRPDFILTDPLVSYADFILPADALELLYAQALVHRPEFGQLQYQIKQQKALIQALKSTHRPALGLQADFSYYGPTSLFGDYSSFGGQGLKSYNWRVGLAFEVPLFDGNRTRAQIEQTTVRLSQVDARSRQVELDIRNELEAVLNDLQRLQSVKRGNALLHEASQANLALGKVQFDNGALPLLDFIQLTIADANSAILLEQLSFEVTSLILSLEAIIGQEPALASMFISGKINGTSSPHSAQR